MALRNKKHRKFKVKHEDWPEVTSISSPYRSYDLDSTNILGDTIDPVTTALGVPIAGLSAPHMEGTLGFYFRVGDALFGVTPRHVLFSKEDNNHYSYNGGPKKEVVLMGTGAFDGFLASIQTSISTLNATITVFQKRAVTYKKRAGAGDQQAATNLEKTEADEKKQIETNETLETFFLKMKLGLDEKKFMSNFRGNVIDFGTEIEPGGFINRMAPQHSLPAKLRQPSGKDLNGDSIRYVIKRGLAMRITIGRLTGFTSHKRRYTVLGKLDSAEVATYPDNSHSGPFSKGGDSEALIAGSLGKFIALLTSGTGLADSSDVTYGTLIDWL